MDKSYEIGGVDRITLFNIIRYMEVTSEIFK